MTHPIRVLELRSVRGTGGGPEKTILSGAAQSDPARYAVTVCYIRDLRDDVFAIDARAMDFGVDYVEVTECHSFDPAIWPALRRLVRARHIDIVHAHDYKTNFYAWLLSKVEPVVPLTTLHGYTGDSRRERIYYALDKRVVRRFPTLIAVSEDLRREVMRVGVPPDRVVRVLNGIDDRAFRYQPELKESARASLGLSPGDVVIGAVGRLEPQKRFDLLMQAFAALRTSAARESLRLVIAGDGSLRAPLERERQRLGLDKTCVLAGHRNDVALLHHAFDVFVQSSDYEGTPNAVLEAMALETPIVATDVGGTSELVTHRLHGLIVPAGDVAAIARAVEDALNDREGARRRSIAARHRVENELSFRSRMRAVERVYDALMSGRGALSEAGALGQSDLRV